MPRTRPGQAFALGRRVVSVAWLGVISLGGCAAPARFPVQPSPTFVALTNFSKFHSSSPAGSQTAEFLSPVLVAPCPWNELVVSWNAEMPAGTGLKIEARPVYPDRAARFFVLGYWSEDPTKQRRESVRGQKDNDGEVLTDTLALREAAQRLQLRITGLAAAGADGGSAAKPRLKMIGLSFLDTARSNASPLGPTHPEVWGKSLRVPERSQRSYPGGRDWCSPTCVSMVLGYWAEQLQRPELAQDVPVVARAVRDPGWSGTGNWAFNVAFAGGFRGLRAHVARLAELADLEKLVAAGVPPILSVSFDLLHGRAEDEGSGHLVVCVGFDREGRVLLHDPWAALSEGETVRRVIPRERLASAWERSRQTVYLIYPETWPLPSSEPRRW